MTLRKNKTDKQKILNEPVHRLFLGFLIPNFIAMFAASLTYFVDAYTIGNGLGEIGLAVVSLTSPISGIMYSIGAFLGFGGSTLFSVYYSVGEKKRAQGVFTSTFLCMMSVIILTMILGIVFVKNIVGWLGTPDNLFEVTMRYSRYILVFAPTYAIEQYITPFLRNDNGERVAMYGAIAGSIVNCVLDIVFVFFLKTDVTGVAWSIGLSLVTICIIDMSALLRKSSSLRFAAHPDMMWDLKKAVSIGFPSMVAELRSSLVSFVYNWMLLLKAGESEVAVYGILANLSSIIMLLLMGPSNSMQPIVSSNFGARKHDRSKEALKYSIIYSLGISLFFAMIGSFFTREVTMLFIDDGNLSFIDIAMPAIRLAFVSYVFRGLSNQFSIYLQSMSANKVAMTYSVLRGIVFPIVIVIVMGILFGVKGIWYSMVVAEIAGTIMGIYVVRNSDPYLLEAAFVEDVEL
ncbi:MAG: hypothetical protein IKX97_03170 [Erysipelotrichaceae bacterium]|nr:hypothetical protein [Erysipelotrichaceae bacterium]